MRGLVARHVSGIAVVAACAFSLVACSNVGKQLEDKTKLEGPARGNMGRELEVHLTGGPPELARDFVWALGQDLAQGDLFESIEGESAASAYVGTEARTACLKLDVQSTSAGAYHDLIRMRDAYIVRYELECALTDRSGTCVLSGPVSGIGCDDVSDPDKLSESKKRDIDSAARRDAAMKIGRLLRKAVDENVGEKLKALQPITLPPGVGPVPIAVLGLDDDPAAKKRRAVALAHAVAAGLQRLGSQLAVTPQDEVEQELGMDPTQRPKSLEKLSRDDLERLHTRIGARLYVTGSVTADGEGVVATAGVKTVYRGELQELGRARASAEGPGAVGLVGVELARQIGAIIEKNPPTILPKKEEEDTWMPQKKEDKEKDENEKKKKAREDD